VTAESAVRVRAIASSATMATRPEQARPVNPADHAEVEMVPAWSWQLLSRVGPVGPPPLFATAGRGDQPMRISARVRLGTAIGPGPGPMVNLRWRFLDGRGQTVT